MRSAQARWSRPWGVVKYGSLYAEARATTSPPCAAIACAAGEVMNFTNCQAASFCLEKLLIVSGKPYTVSRSSGVNPGGGAHDRSSPAPCARRSEEHTSEL